MAIIDFRGFSESTAISDFTSTGAIFPVQGCGASNLVIGTNGTFGDNYLALSDASSNVIQAKITWPTPVLNLVWGARITIRKINGDTPDARYAFMLLDAAGNAQITVSVNVEDGSILVYRGFGGLIGRQYLSPPDGVVQIASAPAGTLLTGTSRYLEVGAIISSSGGSVIVRIDGNIVISVSNISTVANGTAPAISGIFFENHSGYSIFGMRTLAYSVLIQHIYVTDNTGPAPLNGFLGDVRVTGQPYAASSGVPAFTPSGAATNVAVCATNPPVPATIRNVSTTVGDTDTYTVQPLPPSTTTVYAVGVRTLAAKDAAGTRSLQNKLTSGTATTSGVSVSLGIAPVYVRDNFGTDPGTAGPWTVAAVNALKPSYTGG